ncbi:MAG: hypothetical protein LBU88_01435 [Treponema sp.]|jgi:hypothetical protein|nr:hypothetical protein [Treponema sp.]
MIKTISKYIIFLLIIFFLCNCDCDNSKGLPYNSQEAGAKIIGSFDITDSVWYHSYNSDIAGIKNDFDLFENNGFVYLRTENNIFIFDKNTMVKTREIEIQVPDAIKHNLRMFGYQGFFIINDFALIQYSNPIRNYDGFFYSQFIKINLINGETIIMDEAELFDTELKSSFPLLMGYDKANDLLWFCLGNQGVSFFYFFNYNNETFILEKTVNISDFSSFFYYYPNVSITIRDTDCWLFYYIRSKSAHIEKINISKPENTLHIIKVEHLGVDNNYLYFNYLTRPGNIIYDPPYIWVMVVRNERIQMLKLLPN